MPLGEQYGDRLILTENNGTSFNDKPATVSTMKK